MYWPPPARLNAGLDLRYFLYRVRFRRFRLISIDTHSWSEHDKQS